MTAVSVMMLNWVPAETFPTETTSEFNGSFTAHNVLESEQDRARRDDRVLSEMRHGAVGRNAVDRDLKVVTACHQLSIFDKDLSGIPSATCIPIAASIPSRYP